MSAQDTAATLPHGYTGKLGLWCLIGSEIMIFAGIIGSFILFRLAHPEWARLAEHLSVMIGSINTLVLLTSSFTMVKAFAATSRRDRKAACGYLLATALFGLVFIGIKSHEYAGKFSHGFYPNAGLFWAFYFTMTGLHALHVLIGIGAILALFVFGLRDRLWPIANRVELIGLYWHFVDVVWIFLFPLLYLTS